MNEQDLIELELQEELRAMFEVDTQNYLQKYLNLTQQLQPETWQNDIQEIYRAIHTIKGGSVTVGADAILYVATVLEDLLSDLRYLDTPPFLEDKKLNQMLLEAGELLAATITINLPEEDILTAVNPNIERIKTLHEQIKKTYLPEWNEQSLLHQEFAEQGFDLVVLDLEMALENLVTESKIPKNTREIAALTLTQLQQIGEDLQLAEGWQQLLTKADTLLTTLDLKLWQSQWFPLLADLKNCAKHGGIINTKIASENLFEDKEAREFNTFENDDLADLDELLPDDFVPENVSFSEEDLADLDNLLPDDLENTIDVTDEDDINDFLDTEFENLAEVLSDEIFNDDVNDINTEDELNWNFEDATPSKLVYYQEKKEPDSSDIRISVPLKRLDKTAQNLVETLLATRSSQVIYAQLKSQLSQLFILAQENTKYITNLRQIQDEYAHLNEIKSINNNPSEGLILEQYRQGYITINRLLETSLRLSELGAEVAESAWQTENNLQNLDRSILNLQASVEESRLLSFQKLAFRARAIIRDLNNRYQKNVELSIEGEQIELDAGTAAQLEPILLHLLRNAFDHGIESPEVRIERDKSPTGTINLCWQRQGKNFLLKIQDDGQGINAQRISQIARSKNLPITDTRNNQQLLAVICQPGFTSQTQVSEISGRGVGMNVVADQVRQLGGKMNLETTPHFGTTFTIEIPPPQLLIPCILVRLATTRPQSRDLTFAFPTDEITSTNLVGQLNLSQLEHSNYIYTSVVTSNNGISPAFDLKNYGNRTEINRTLLDTAIAIYVKSSKLNQGVWFLADELLGQRELLINPLPSPLKPPVGMMGLSLDLDGSLIPVLAPVNLAEFLIKTPKKTKPVEKVFVATKTESKNTFTSTILVVDDAALVRRRLQVSLKAFGYNVQTCVDGLDAWTWLQNNQPPTLLITDIEMPEMDGFTLIDRCRQSGFTFPVLVISSRLSEEWGKEAQRVGANDYLTKGFSTPDLRNKIDELLNI